MQPVLLHMLQQGAAGAVLDAFRRARGAGGEHREQGMVERVAQPARPVLATNGIAEQIGKPVQGHRPLAGGKRAVVQRDDRGEARQAGCRSGDALGDGDAQIPWLCPETTEQHHRLERGETREDGGNAHVRRAAGEGRAKGSGGQGGNDRLGIVACDRRDMIARAHTQPLQRRRQPGDRDAQCATREPVAAAAGVTGRQDRLVGTAGEEALGVVETEIREKAGGLADIADTDRLDRTLPRQVAPLQEEAPEAAELLHRKAVHRSMIRQVLPRPGLTPLSEGAQLRMRDSLVIGTEHHFRSTSARGTTTLPLALFTGSDAKSHHNHFLLPKLDPADCLGCRLFGVQHQVGASVLPPTIQRGQHRQWSHRII